jgi:hypothetical protein
LRAAAEGDKLGGRPFVPGDKVAFVPVFCPSDFVPFVPRLGMPASALVSRASSWVIRSRWRLHSGQGAAIVSELADLGGNGSEDEGSGEDAEEEAGGEDEG